MQKMLIWIAVGFLLLLLAIFMVVPVIANNKLDRLIEQANQDGNQLSVGERNLAFRLTHFNLAADSIGLDQTSSGQQFSGAIKRLEVNGLKLLPLLFNNRISISEVLLDQPEISMAPSATDTIKKGNQGPEKNIFLGKFIISEGAVDRYSEGGDLALRALGIRATATALQLPLAPAAAPSFSFSTDSLFIPQKQKSDWSFNDLTANTDQRELRLRTVQLSPRQAARPFLTSLETKDNWLALRLDDVILQDVSFDSLLSGGMTVLPEVAIGDFNLMVFENPSLPAGQETRRKSFLIEKFRKIPVPTLLKEMRVERAQITYGVMMEDSGAPEINFREGSINLNNFSTYPQPDSAVITADFTFGENSPLRARFALDQSGDGRHFSATGQLRDYNITDINPFMTVAAEAFVEGGHLNELNYDFKIANEVAKGKLLFLYEGLELKLEGKVAWLKNIMEDIAIRDSNPRSGGDLVHGTVHNEHEPDKSFFNLYWKSIVSGLRSSVAGEVFTPKELKATELKD